MVSKKITRTLSVIVIVFLLVSVTAAGFYFGLNYVLSQNSRFEQLEKLFGSDGAAAINKDTPDAVEIIIPRASDTQQIAEILSDKGIIKNVFMFHDPCQVQRLRRLPYMAGNPFCPARHGLR